MSHSLVAWLDTLSAVDWNQRPAGIWEGSEAGNPDELLSVERHFGARFPDDYRDLLLASDGGALSGPNECITLEPIGKLIDRNTEERFVEALRGMCVIGDNAGGAVYFYDPRNRIGRGNWALYWVNLGDLAVPNARFAGKTLSETLLWIANGVSFFEEPSIG